MGEAELLDSISLRRILVLLADGCFHSGEELGIILGVSRAAVWKHLQKLELLGICLESVRGRGYCIEGGLDLLVKEKIEQLLVDGCPSLIIELFPVLDSTNSYLMRNSLSAGRVCIAETQTAGRGRRGRTWVSPFAQNIYFSLGWGFDGGVTALEGLSLVVGVAIVRSLRNLGVENLQLKWPNDVLYKNKKLAGILLEMTGDPSGYCQVIIGIGLNVAMNFDAAKGIDQPWIDLKQIIKEENLPSFSRNELVSSLLTQLSKILVTFHKDGFACYRDEWLDLNAHYNTRVELRNGNTLHHGIMIGVDSSGALMLRTQQGDEIFHGGELSMRIAS